MDFEDDLNDLDARVDNIEWRIDNLELQQFQKENYLFFFYPETVKRYINNQDKIRNNSRYSFYPLSDNDFNSFFQELKKFSDEKENFIPELFKYDDQNINLIAEEIANEGLSGFLFLEMVEKVNDLNKPILLFYGIEQLAVFFFNLHFNFTHYNTWKELLKSGKINNFRLHGLGSNEFNDVKIEDRDDFLHDLLIKKISIKKYGVFSRFLSLYRPDLSDLFLNEEKISFQDLLTNFFLYSETQNYIYPDSISIPGKIKKNYKSFYGEKKKINLDSAIVSIYLLSFLLSHLNRYKIGVWKYILESNQNNLKYYLNFFLKFSKDFFLQLIFKRINIYQRGETNFLRRLGSMMVL